MIIVKVKDRDIERALRTYKHKRSRSKLDRELIERKEYTKPTTLRREQKQKAVRKQQREVILDKIATGELPESALQTKKKKTNNF